MSNVVKKIGLIGGVGPQASAFIYTSIIQHATERYAADTNDAYPYVLLASVPVPDFISDMSRLDDAKKLLLGAAQSLEQAGCDVLAIGSNTVHILFEEIQQAVSIPCISMIDLVAKRCHELQYSKVALLGSPTLLDSSLYDNALTHYDIELIKPDALQRRVCEQVIRNVLSGSSKTDGKSEYIEILTSMIARGAEGIILGCTELPQVLNYEALGDKALYSDRILAEGLCDYYYDSE